MKKLSKNIDKIGFYLLSLIIIIFSLIIGANEKGLRVLPISILLLLIIIFLVCKKIIKKDESLFFKNKIDISVFIFTLITILPLVFKTYASFSYEIECILKYTFYYSVYVLGRNVINKKENINSIYTIIIFTSLIPITLGLNMNGSNNTFTEIIKYFNIGYNYNFKPGFTFGYANTMAIYISLCIFLSLYKIYNTKDKLEKFIYIGYSLFGLYIIYKSYARMIVLLLFILLFIFFINKYKNTIIKNKNKIFIVSTISLIVILSIFTFTLSTSSPMYTENDSYDTVLNYKFKKNTKYKITVDMDLLFDSTQNEQLNNSAFNIKLVSVNKYYKEKLIYNKFFGNGHFKNDIEFKTSNNTEYIKMYISNNYKGAMQINNIYINDEEYIIHYKYLPVMVGKFINQIKVKDKSIVERFYFYKDSIRIFKKHMIIGNGGNAWQSLAKQNQDYAFSVKETHSYFFELLISFGLIGIIAYFIMLINILMVLIKNNKKEEKNILLYALGILLIHSILFDFNMSFMFIQIITYILFACILTDSKKDKNINKKYDYPVFIILGVSLITYSYMTLYEYSIINYYLPLNRNIIDKRLINIEKEKINSKKKLDILKDTINKEPYYNQNYIYNTYFNILNTSKLTDKEFNSYYNFIISKIKNINPYSKYYINNLYVREKIIYKSINSLENTNYKNKDKYIKELKNILVKEHNKYIKYIKDIDRNDSEQYVIDNILRQYNKMYEEVK